MRARRVCWLALPLIAFGATLPASEAADPTAQQAIRKVLDDQEKAWNRGDLEAFLAGYWQSQELLFFSGKDHTRGWQATLERYRKRYQADGKQMGRLAFSEIEVAILSPEAAWVRGRWALAQGQDKHGGLFTLIFKKVPAGWRIVHDHTSGE